MYEENYNSRKSEKKLTEITSLFCKIELIKRFMKALKEKIRVKLFYIKHLYILRCLKKYSFYTMI